MEPMLHALLSRRAPWAALAAVLGCSAVSAVDYAQCSDGATCRQAFGLGYTCGSAGLCEEIEVLQRCKDVYPVDLLKDPEKYSNVVVFGSLFDNTAMTGDGKLIKAASLAIDEANANGLAEGRLFGIVHCDYQENPGIDGLTSEEAAIQGAKYLVDQLGAVAIIGPGTSGLAEAVYRELEKPSHATKTLIVSPSATSPSLTDIDATKPGLFWRTAPPDSVLGAKLAEYMEEVPIANAIVLYEDTTYGKGLAIELDKNFEDQLTLRPYTDPSVIPQEVIKIANENPTPTAFAVVFITSEVSQVTSFLNAAGVSQSAFYSNPEVKIFLGDTAYNADVIKQTQANAAMLYPNVRGVFPGAPSGPVYQLFLATYAAKYSNEDASDASYSAHTYDATWLALYGAAWSYYQHNGDIRGPWMAEGLQNISNGDAFDINATTWSSIKKAFREKRGINIRGASGELDYDPVTEETTAPVLRWTIEQSMGAWVFKETQVP